MSVVRCAIASILHSVVGSLVAFEIWRTRSSRVVLADHVGHERHGACEINCSDILIRFFAWADGTATSVTVYRSDLIPSVYCKYTGIG